MNGKSSTISTPPLVLSLPKESERVFQQPARAQFFKRERATAYNAFLKDGFAKAWQQFFHSLIQAEPKGHTHQTAS
jgi:hypothetical protein